MTRTQTVVTVSPSQPDSELVHATSSFKMDEKAPGETKAGKNTTTYSYLSTGAATVSELSGHPAALMPDNPADLLISPCENMRLTL